MTDDARPHPAYGNDELTRWREAVIDGGLPMPTRSDRWQVLRAGVVNLWEFEEAEYWYADGWVQLTGRNETGKSSLMALTTLIPWLGDTSTSNIDTLGGSGKQFRYYVEPTTLDGDRRDSSSTSSRGWLWVEYARLSADGEPEYYTTLGYAEARRASATLTPHWCTAHGTARVRAGLDLVVSRAVRSPKEVRESLADVPGQFTFPHPSAGTYRSQVAGQLLGADVGQLESIGKMLRVARTPKLGESLNASFVTEKLRDALPGLENSEIQALADGWDQLDRARRDLTIAKDNVEALRAFVNQAWMPYARARLRQGADAAAAARSAFDGVTRKVRESTEALATAEADVKRLDDAINESTLAAEQARDQREAHLQSRAYRDARGRAQNLDRAIERSTRARSVVAEVTARVTRHEQDLAVANDELTAQLQHVEALARELEDLTLALAGHASPAGLSSARDLAAERDWTRLRRAATGRIQALQRLDVLERAHHGVEGKAVQAEERASALRVAARVAVQAAEEAWTKAEDERGRLATALAAWADAVDHEEQPTAGDVDRWVAGLPTDAAAPALLAETVRVEWFAPRLEAHAHRRRAAEARRDHLDTERSLAVAEIERLRTAPEPIVAEPTLWKRSARSGRAGAPFWRLVDPRPGVADDVLARVEAALAAMGILDAWVLASGLIADGDAGPAGTVGVAELADNFLAPSLAPVAGPSLGDVLAVSAAATYSTDAQQRARALVVQTALDRISWHENAIPDRLPGNSGDVDGHGERTAYAMAGDGSWMTPMATGRAEALHATAELIGESARQAARQRRIDDLSAQVAGLDDALAGERAVIEAATSAETRLRDSLAQVPKDADLVRLLTTASTLDMAAERQATVADEAEAAAVTRRTEADSARATLLEHAREHSLPIEHAERLLVGNALTEVVRDLDTIEVTGRRHADAVGVAATTTRRREGARATLEASRAKQTEATRELSQAEATESALRGAIDDDDAEILVRADRLAEDERAATSRATALGVEKSEAVEARGSAKSVLGQAEADRAVRQGERDSAFAEFWRLVDAGLADQAGVDLPESDQRTIEATRDQVAALRERVPDPRGWASDPATQADVVRTSVQRLTERLDTLRVSLEAGGRTTAMDLSHDPVSVAVVLEASGREHPPRQALLRLQEIHDELAGAYDESVQGTLTELLGSTFIEHLRDRLTELRRLTGRINDVLGRHPTGTTRTRLRIHLAPAAGATEAVLSALEGGDAILDPDVADRVRDFLRSRIEEARRHSETGAGEWRNLLAEALDYRRWFSVTLQKKTGDGGHWTPLTSQNYAHLSGGARVVMLMLPFVATLTALYESMPTAPRPFWLDEAFDGLDTTNRGTVLGLLGEFDLDVLVVGPGRLLNSVSVPVAAIYQVIRAEDPLPGADLAVELWAGGDLTPLEPATDRLGVVGALAGSADAPSLFADRESGADGG